jgi:hypothetical protein
MKEDFSFSPHVSHLPFKNLILPLIKIWFAETEIFLVQILGKIRFLETKVVFQGKKNLIYRIRIFY